MSRYEVFFNDIRRIITNHQPDNKTYEKIQKDTNQHTNKETNKQRKRYAWHSETYFVNRGEEIKFRDIENNTKRASIITFNKSNPNNLPKYNDFIMVGEVKDIESINNYNFLSNYF